MRVVYGGDPHGVVSELADCRALVEATAKFAVEQKADRIVCLGDLTDAMSYLRLEVLDFWRWGVDLWLEAVPSVVLLVGNHDLANDRSCHALWPLAGRWNRREDGPFGHRMVTVVDGPVQDGPLLYLPYVHGKEEFVRLAREHGVADQALVCHQSFDGAQYENGMYVGEEGVDAALLPQHTVISGHIHKAGMYGKVRYVGSPRWRISSDANEEKAVWMYDHALDGRIVDAVALDTSAFCRKIVQYVVTPDSLPAVPAAGPLLDVRVDVRGPAGFVAEHHARLQDLGAKVRTFRTDATVIEVRESEGVGVAWGRFLGTFRPANGTGPERIAELAAEGYGLRVAS